jgi:hypothetical protein
MPKLTLLSLVLILAGCAATEQLQPVPISGGRLLGVKVGPHGPLPGSANGFEVVRSNLAPAAQDNQAIYQFGFVAPPGTSLQRVQIEDISDEDDAPLVDDQKPWLEQNLWHIETAPLDCKDPKLSWVFTVTTSLRVYRFIVTETSGRKTSMYQVVGYPNFAKAAIRSKWGEKY